MKQPAGRVRIHRAVAAPELTTARARRAVQAALEQGGRPELRVDVVLVDDAGLVELHARYLGDASPTDVIAFDLRGGEAEASDDGPDAEIYASAERARAVARTRGVDSGRELALYLVHGALHLCGHDDREPRARRRMRAAEARVMEALGYPPDGAPHHAGA